MLQKVKGRAGETVRRDPTCRPAGKALPSAASPALTRGQILSLALHRHLLWDSLGVYSRLCPFHPSAHSHLFSTFHTFVEIPGFQRKMVNPPPLNSCSCGLILCLTQLFSFYFYFVRIGGRRQRHGPSTSWTGRAECLDSTRSD